MTELTNTPHDKIFRLSLSNLEVAKDFLKIHLPKQILKIINLKNLTVCPNSYITEELAESLSDILYKTTINRGKQDCYIYTIVEHQSVPLWNMPLRLMQYQLAVIDTHLRQNPKQKKLPIVVPLLVYNGTKSPYPLSLNIFDLFHDPELAKKTFAKPAHLVDVTAMSDQEIKKHNIVGLLEFSQKHIRDRKFLKLTIKSLTYMVNQLLNSVPTQEINNNHWVKNYISGVLHYVFYFANIVDDLEFYKELEEIEFIKKENIMGALAKKIEKQGMQKGIHQGIQTVALKLLEKGIERGIIIETTGLSSKEIDEISNKKPEEI